MTNHEISKEWIKAFGYLNEPQKRWFAAVKAKELGYGGVSQVSRTTGLSRTTVTQGLRDLEEDGSLSLDSDRLRREGGGRKYLTHKSPELLKAIEGILEESFCRRSDEPLTVDMQIDQIYRRSAKKIRI